MGYIVDHEIIKLWNIYKPMIYLKDGLHTSPLLGLNVVQYTKPLTNFKNAQGSPKNGLRRSANAILRRYCRLKTDVKIIIQSRDIVGRFCYSFQRVTFLHLWHHCVAYKGKRSCRGLRVAPLFCPSRFKKFTAFSAHKSGLEKIGANNAPKKLPPAIFACPSFANKIRTY